MIPSVLPTYNRAPLQFVKGEGSWLIEADGRRFLDLGSGIERPAPEDHQNQRQKPPHRRLPDRPTPQLDSALQLSDRRQAMATA